MLIQSSGYYNNNNYYYCYYYYYYYSSYSYSYSYSSSSCCWCCCCCAAAALAALAAASAVTLLLLLLHSTCAKHAHKYRANHAPESYPRIIHRIIPPNHTPPTTSPVGHLKQCKPLNVLNNKNAHNLA